MHSIVTDLPVVIFDMDNVLVDFTEKFLRELNQRFPHPEGLVYTKADHTHFTLRHAFPHIPAKDIDAIMAEPGFFADMHPLEGALEAMEVILAANVCTPFICTSPFISNPTCASDKFEWVGKYLGRTLKHRTIVTTDKTLVYGEVLVDDKEVITGVHTPSWQHIVFKCEHNSSYTGDKLTMSWDSLEPLFTVLEKLR